LLLTPLSAGSGVTRAFLSLGSNLGDRRRFLVEAISSLGERVTAVSPVYETEPVGGPEQERFLNLVVQLETDVAPRELLAVCHRLESAAQRVRQQQWGPRTLDVDIVWIDGIVVEEPDLQVPHPRWTERRFVLAPLRDLAPDLVDRSALERSQGHVTRVEPLTGWEAGDGAPEGGDDGERDGGGVSGERDDGGDGSDRGPA